MEKLGGLERAAVGVLTGHRGLERTETAFSAVDVSLCNQNCFKGANNLISISQSLFHCLLMHLLPGFPSSFCFR